MGWSWLVFGRVVDGFAVARDGFVGMGTFIWANGCSVGMPGWFRVDDILR